MARLMTEQLGKGFAQRVGTFADHAKALHHLVETYADMPQILPIPSDIKHERILRPPKEGVADNERYDPTKDGGSNGLCGRKFAIVDREPESVQHIQHRIELEKHSPVRRQKIQRVNDRAKVKPRGQYDLQDVRHIAKEHIRSRHKQAESQCKKE